MSTPEDYLASRGARRRSSSSGKALGTDNPSPKDDRFINIMSGIDTNMNQQLLPRTRSVSSPIDRLHSKSSSPANGYSRSGSPVGSYKGHAGHQKHSPFNPSVKTIVISVSTFIVTLLLITIASYTGHLSFDSVDCGCDFPIYETETGGTRADLVRVEAELARANKMYLKKEAQVAERDVTIETMRAEMLNDDSVPDTLKAQYKASQKALKGTLSKLHNLEDKMGKSKQCIQRVEKLQAIVENNDDEIYVLRQKLTALQGDDSSRVATSAPKPFKNEASMATPAPKPFKNAASMRSGGGSVLSSIDDVEIDLASNGNDGKEHSASFYHKEIAARNKYAAKLQNDMLAMTAQMKSMQTSVMRQSAEPKGRGTLDKLEPADIDSITGEYGRLVERDTILTQRLVRLRESLQVASRELISLKWGDGPHQVEVKVKFPESSLKKSQAKSGKFIVEMGSLKYTPHTIHYWLSQVALGLWNDSSFVRNAPHVIQADPQNVKGIRHIKSFEDKHLPLTVAFQEYDENQPHDKYTLGVPGRPGGPDWYISTEDNNEAHGPNGQLQNEMPEEADPCFARVVSGFDVVDRVHAMPIKSPQDNDLLMHVEIESITILSNDRSRLVSGKGAKPAKHNVGGGYTTKIAGGTKPTKTVGGTNKPTKIVGGGARRLESAEPTKNVKEGGVGDESKRSSTRQSRDAKRRSTATAAGRDSKPRFEKVNNDLN